MIIADDMTEAQVKAYRLADNKAGEGSMWDYDLLDAEMADIFDFDMAEYGFIGENPLFDDENEAGGGQDGSVSHLVDEFIVPPFSVLDTRQGYWQDRKRAWREKGACTTEGRADNLLGLDPVSLGKLDTGTSVFDPVLCEVMYKWFCPKTGFVFDPFAGGIPRGAVAICKGLDYLGLDLSKEQIDSNNRLIKGITGPGTAKWINDDALNMDDYIEDGAADFILTCPPYFDLEKYTDNPRDLSNMDYDDFVATYSQILDNAARKLKDNRFAVIVLSDVRDEKGAYRTLCDLTRNVMQSAGLAVYNEIILLNAVGSASMRARQTFKNRKCTRSHQEVIVFYKGDISKIQKEFGILQAEEDILAQEMEEGMDG